MNMLRPAAPERGSAMASRKRQAGNDRNTLSASDAAIPASQFSERQDRTPKTVTNLNSSFSPLAECIRPPWSISWLR